MTLVHVHRTCMRKTSQVLAKLSTTHTINACATGSGLRSLQVWRPRGGHASGNEVDKTTMKYHDAFNASICTCSWAVLVVHLMEDSTHPTNLENNKSCRLHQKIYQTTTGSYLWHLSLASTCCNPHCPTWAHGNHWIPSTEKLAGVFISKNSMDLWEKQNKTLLG